MKTFLSRSFRKNQTSGVFGYIRTVPTLALFALLVACGDMGNKGPSGFFGNYGYLSPSDDVTDAFETYTVKPDRHYYFSGPDESPFAILNLRKEIALESDYWKPEKVTPSRLNNWLSWMHLNYSQTYGIRPRGYTVIDPDGNPIGEWYSACNFTVIKPGKEGGVKIYTPISGPCFPKNIDSRGERAELDETTPHLPKADSQASAMATHSSPSG
jgi:hypothetical protein